MATYAFVENMSENRQSETPKAENQHNHVSTSSSRRSTSSSPVPPAVAVSLQQVLQSSALTPGLEGSHITQLHSITPGDPLQMGNAACSACANTNSPNAVNVGTPLRACDSANGLTTTNGTVRSNSVSGENSRERASHDHSNADANTQAATDNHLNNGDSKFSTRCHIFNPDGIGSGGVTHYCPVGQICSTGFCAERYEDVATLARVSRDFDREHASHWRQ